MRSLKTLTKSAGGIGSNPDRHYGRDVDRVYSVKVSECGKSMHGDSRGWTRPKHQRPREQEMKFTVLQN